ncbi:MAG: FAD-dependent oxidoreductase, partial [Phycisphaerae bacterium]
MTPKPSDIRRTALDALRNDVLDVLVIGGGIVGAGVARDAALRGLRVGLVEQYDFASGTSGRSSRLLHGGLRYLAQGRIGLVRQASREKKILAAIAPHLVRPLAFTFPTFKGSGWPRWKLRLGVKLYDWLNPGGNLGRSTGLSFDDVRASVPGIRTEDLTGGVRYFDALTNDARLVIDTLRSAAVGGAIVANYVALASASRDGATWRCHLRDAETGEEFDARARAVVNAAGAWAARFPASRVRLRLTKGIHVVVDRARLPVTDA